MSAPVTWPGAPSTCGTSTTSAPNRSSIRARAGLLPTDMVAISGYPSAAQTTDLQSIRTTALKDGNGYRINGAKTFISNGQIADLIVVVAKTDPSQGDRRQGIRGRLHRAPDGRHTRSDHRSHRQAVVCETEWEILDDCLQLHGGYGYVNDYPIARLWRNARVQRLYGGTSEIMKVLIARSL